MFLFKPKKPEEPKAQVESKANIDLEIIMKMVLWVKLLNKENVFVLEM